MPKTNRWSAALLLALLLSASPVAPAFAQINFPPYEDRLLRLSEIIGAVHYIRTLCAKQDEGWRDKMQALIELEGEDSPTRARLTAAFNRGYRAFASVHTKCNEAALEAEVQYRKEGLDLASAIIARYGN